MARFDKLEFESQAGSRSAQESSYRPQTDSTTWAARADQARRRGTYESALQYYSRALEDDKTYVAGWVGQVQMLVMLEEYPEAEVWSRKAIELFPAAGDLLAARAQSLVRLQRRKEAFATADAAMSQSGQSAYRWAVRGELLLADRQRTDQHCFDKALQVDIDWLVPTEIALTYLYYGQPGNALSRARSAVDRDSDAVYAWYVQGLCQARLGLSVHARRSFEACLGLFPGFRDVEEQLHATAQHSSLWHRFRGLWSR